MVKTLRPSNASDWLSQNINTKYISCHMGVVLLYVEHVTSLSLMHSLFDVNKAFFSTACCGCLLTTTTFT